MKKYILLILSIMLFCLCGCSKTTQDTDEKESLKLGEYVIENYDKEISIPNLYLKENNKFIFKYSAYSNTILMGNYEIKDNNLILKVDGTSEKEEKFVFEVKEGKLIFQADQSSELPNFAQEEIHNGVVFVLLENNDKDANEEAVMGIAKYYLDNVKNFNRANLEEVLFFSPENSSWKEPIFRAMQEDALLSYEIVGVTKINQSLYEVVFYYHVKNNKDSISCNYVVYIDGKWKYVINPRDVPKDIYVFASYDYTISSN